MKDVFWSMVNLYSREIAGRGTEAERVAIAAELSRMNGEDVRTMVSNGLRVHFIPEDPNSTPYNIDDMIDFLGWLHKRFDLGTVPPREG